MSHIVIIGAGIGGTTAAYALRKRVSSEHRITVIHPVPYFQFVPSNVWVGIGSRDRQGITVDLAPAFKQKNIDFVAQPVTHIDAENNQLSLNDGSNIDYDYLVITTGAKLAFEEVEGAGPDGGYSHSVCTVDHAEKTYEAYQDLLKKPGHIVIGTLPGASCFGPAYEFAFLVNQDLRKRGIRDQYPMTFVTSEPYIGHLGLGGVNDSKSILESELRKANINWITNAKTEKFEKNKIQISELNKDATVYKQHEIESDFAMLIPAFKGIDPVAQVKDLCNPRGFVLVDEHQRSTAYPNIFAAGVCIAIAPLSQTPVATGVPKTGYMIETMASTIARNISAELNNLPATAKATNNAICLADLGKDAVAFVAKPQIPPRNVDWAKKGKWARYAKILFEKYFLYKVRHGISRTWYEKVFLRLFKLGHTK